MPISMRVGRVIAAVVVVAAGAFAGSATAQDDDYRQALKDFVYYTSVAKPELAAAYGQKLLDDAGMTAAELAELVDDELTVTLEDFDWALDRGSRTEGLGEIAEAVAERVEQGRLDLARDPARIKEAVKMLVGTQRQRRLANQRLRAAGEYAVPELLRVVTDENDGRMKDACATVLRDIGRLGVMPMCVALPEIDPISQRRVCDVLGAIGYPSAAPSLKALSMDNNADSSARDAASRAFRGLNVYEENLDELYANLAAQYFRSDASLIAYPLEPTNNVWSYDAFVGLKPQPVPTAIYPEVMAMREAASALAINGDNARAVALFVAANLKRENDLPEGEADPIFGDDEYTPGFYATVFGTTVCLDVLALALDATDTPLVRDAIAALSQTTGGSNLFSTGAGRQPLLEALDYPDRRVQYEAALALARALPDRRFGNDERVVPLLASAVRSGAQSYALVLSDDEENRRQEAIRLEALGYTIAGADRTLGSLQGAIVDAPGIDLVAIRMSTIPNVEQAVKDLANMNKTSAAPVVILAPGVDVPQLKLEYQDENRIAVTRAGPDAVVFEAVVTDLLNRAVGGRMTESDAEIYAFEAIDALKDIAISSSPAYEAADAEPSLIEALDTRSGQSRLLVASVLALINSDAAQRALFDAALAADGGERVDLLNHVATSVKRFGNRSEQRHLVTLLDLIENSGGSTAEAAARVHGAMNLSSSDAVRLVQP